MKDAALSEEGRGMARHDRGTAWARHAMCESALTGLGYWAVHMHYTVV